MKIRICIYIDTHTRHAKRNMCRRALIVPDNFVGRDIVTKTLKLHSIQALAPGPTFCAHPILHTQLIDEFLGILM